MGLEVPHVDPALIVRAQRGDNAAHARLYELFSPMVYTLARRMLISAALAEDVLQETFVEVLRKVGSYRGDAHFAFWLKRIAVNKCLIHLRSGWASRRVEMDVPDEAPGPGTSQVAESQMALERALAELSDSARAVVWLYDVEGYTHKEIGRMMGRSTSYSKSQLARAHGRLRDLLEGSAETETELCTGVLKTC